MSENIQEYPDNLYRYRAFNEEWLKSFFTENHLYFPSPGDFNDPFDCSPMITYRDASRNEIDTYLDSLKDYLGFHRYVDWIAFKYDLFMKIRNNDPNTIKILYDSMKRKNITKINNEYGILSLSGNKKRNTNVVTLW